MKNETRISRHDGDEQMKICDYCSSEIKKQEYSIEIGKWLPQGDNEYDEVLFKELHSKCADEVISHIKKYKKNLKKKAKVSGSQKTGKSVEGRK